MADSYVRFRPSLGGILSRKPPLNPPIKMNRKVFPEHPKLFSVTALIILDDTSLFTYFLTGRRTWQKQ